MSPFAVPYADLGLQTSAIRTELLNACGAVLDSGRYITGPELASFESEFASYCGVQHAIGVANGTCALQLVMRRLNLEPGSEVITAPNSFIASAGAIAQAGGRPTFADIGPDLNIDPAAIESAITGRTRAIMPVHLTGRPARMEQIMALAERHGLFVLEDSAQAVGARLQGRLMGSWGDASCFSLHPLKNLHAFGDGGMITTDDEALNENVRMSRNHGMKNRDECEFWGCNCRLDELQAAMLRVQLPLLDGWTEKRRRLAFRYNELLNPYVSVPEEGDDEFCVYQTYVIQAERRNELREFLRGRGVEALVHYATPIHHQPAATSLGYQPEEFPNALRACEQILSLPLYPGLTEAQQDTVIDLIAEFYGASS